MLLVASLAFLLGMSSESSNSLAHALAVLGFAVVIETVTR